MKAGNGMIPYVVLWMMRPVGVQVRRKMYPQELGALPNQCLIWLRERVLTLSAYTVFVSCPYTVPFI